MTVELFDPLAAPFRLDGTNGRAVVLTHGFTGVPAHFRPMAEFLNAAGYTVEVPLLAGHGTTIDDMETTDDADWLASVLTAVSSVADHDRVHVGGLSMGGLLSVIVAARRPVGSVFTLNSPIIFRDRKILIAGLAHRVKRRVIWDGADEPDLDQEVADYWLTYPGFATRNASHLLRLSRKALDVAPKLDIPSLVIQSHSDESVHPRSGALLASALGRQCRLVWLPDARHNALLDAARHDIHRLVLDHLERP